MTAGAVGTADLVVVLNNPAYVARVVMGTATAPPTLSLTATRQHGVERWKGALYLSGVPVAWTRWAWTAEEADAAGRRLLRAERHRHRSDAHAAAAAGAAGDDDAPATR